MSYMCFFFKIFLASHASLTYNIYMTIGEGKAFSRVKKKWRPVLITPTAETSSVTSKYSLTMQTISIFNQPCESKSKTQTEPRASQTSSKPSASATGFHKAKPHINGKSLSAISRTGSRDTEPRRVTPCPRSKSSCESKRYFLVPRESRKSYYGKAVVEVDPEGNKHLFSYNTRVAQIPFDGVPVVFGIQSLTTLRHVKSFLHEFGFLANDRKQVETLYLAA